MQGRGLFIPGVLLGTQIEHSINMRPHVRDLTRSERSDCDARLRYPIQSIACACHPCNIRRSILMDSSLPQHEKLRTCWKPSKVGSA